MTENSCVLIVIEIERVTRITTIQERKQHKSQMKKAICILIIYPKFFLLKSKLVLPSSQPKKKKIFKWRSQIA